MRKHERHGVSIMSHLLVFVDSDFRGAFVSADLFTAFAWCLGFAPKTQKINHKCSFENDQPRLDANISHATFINS